MAKLKMIDGKFVCPNCDYKLMRFAQMVDHIRDNCRPAITRKIANSRVTHLEGRICKRGNIYKNTIDLDKVTCIYCVKYMERELNIKSLNILQRKTGRPKIEVMTQ